MYLEHIQPPLQLLTYLPSLQFRLSCPTFTFLLIFTLLILLCCSTRLSNGTFPGIYCSTRDQITNKGWLLPKVIKCNSCLADIAVLWLSSPLDAGIFFVWLKLAPGLWMLSQLLSLYVHLHYYVLKILFPQCYPPPLALEVFLTPFPQRSLSTGVRAVIYLSTLILWMMSLYYFPSSKKKNFAKTFERCFLPLVIRNHFDTIFV